MTERFKCLTCSRVISDKYMHERRTDPPHQEYIQIGSEEEGKEELSPTTKWTKELLENELAGQRKISIKISTHEAITELSSQRSAATYDEIILMCINSYHREQVNNGNDPLSAIVTNEEEE